MLTHHGMPEEPLVSIINSHLRFQKWNWKTPDED